MTFVKFLKSTVSAFCIVSACAGALPAYANPEGGVVAAGQASISSAGNTLSVHQSSDRAIIDWRSFNIAPHETTAFHQPSSSSLTLNRVHSMEPSQILGTLTANGHVVIVNPNGVFFGQGSRVDVGSITATTSNISNANFMAGHLNFDQPGVDHGEIVNEGTITAADAGLVNLVAPRVRNSGVIQARLGKINLASGEKFTLDLANDGLLQIAVDKDSLVGQSIKNTGTLSAQGGQIHLTAAAARSAVDGLIINTGVIEAKSFGTKKGSVKLSAAGSNAVENNIAADKGLKQGQTAVVNSGTIDVSGSEAGQTGGDVSLLADQVWLESGSNINASGSHGGGDIKIGGDYQGLGTTPTASRVYVARNTSMSVDALESGDAGRAIVWADDSTNFFGNIYARGGQLSGDGGFVEVSGKEYLNYKGFVDTRAENGQTGLLFLDPANIVIANGSGDGAADGTATFKGAATAGTIASGDAGPSTIYESELEGIAAATNISVAASNSITINNLTTDGNLNLAQNAGRSVTFTTGAGGFIMQNTANTITTAGGALNITTTGGGATLGNLATNGGLITLNVVGNSSVGTISGTGTALTKTGTGTLTMSGNNTYTGTTTLTAGTIIVGSNTALGTGTLSLNGGTLQGDGITRTLASGISLAQNSTIGGSSALAFTSVFTNTNNRTLTNNNAGGFTLAAVNLSSDNNNRTLTIAGTGNTTINGVIANGGTSTASALTKTGTGVLTLGAANTYDGTTTISGGTLRYNINNALDAAAVTVNDGGTYDLNGFSDTIGALTVNSGVTGGSVTTGAGTLTLGGNITSTGGASNASISGKLALGGANRTVTTTNAADGLTISAVISGARSLTKAGAGSLILSGSNTYTLGSTLTAGTITAGSNTAFGTGTVTLNGAILQGDGTARTLANALILNANTTIGGSSALTFTGALTNNNNRTLTNNNAGGFTLGAVNLSSDANNRTLTIDGTGLTTINGVIMNGGTSAASGITKAGTGTLVLNGTNTFAGAKTLTAGTVQVGNNAALGTGTVTLNGATLQGDGTARTLGNALSLAANTTIAGASNLTFSGALTNTLAGNPTLTVNNSGMTTFGAVALSNSATNRTLTIAGTGNTTISGVIANGSTSTASALTKTGAGTLTLSGANTYAGATTVDGGTLRLGAANRISDSSALTVNASGTFDFNSFSETLNAITASGQVNFGTGNTITTAGAQNYTGIVNGGAVSLVSTGGGAITANNAANNFTGQLGVSTTGTVNLRDANALTLGAVSGSTITASAGEDLTLNGVVSASATTGTPLTLSTTGAFINSVGASALQTGVGGRWLVYSATPLGDTRGGLVHNFKQYNAAYGDTVLGTGNGFIYTVAPMITASLTGVVNKTYNGTIAATLSGSNYSTSGTIDGDTVVLNNPTSGVYNNANAGTGKNVAVNGVTISSANNGGVTVYGYQLANGSINGNVGVIDQAALTLSTSDVTRAYNGTLAAAGSAVVTGGTLFGSDNISGGTFAFTNANAGTGKTVTTSGVTVNDGNGGNNYAVSYVDNTTSTINKALLTFSTSDVTKQFDGNTTANGTAILTAGTLYTNQSNGNILDSFNGGTFLFDSPAAGTGKTVSVSGVTVNDGNAGNNYTVTYLDNTNNTIFVPPVANIVSSISASNPPLLGQKSTNANVINNGLIINSDFKFLENIGIEIGFLDTLNTGTVESTPESFESGSPDDPKQKECADGNSEC